MNKTPPSSRLRKLLFIGAIALLLLPGCGALRRARRAVSPPAAVPPPTMAPTSAPTAIPEAQSGTAPTLAAPTPLPSPTTAPPTEAPTSAPTPTPQPQPGPTEPPLEAMDFVERNNLYLDLLAARQAEGVDTTTAEELYISSMEAMLGGDTVTADQFLNQAILSLLQ